MLIELVQLMKLIMFIELFSQLLFVFARRFPYMHSHINRGHMVAYEGLQELWGLLRRKSKFPKWNSATSGEPPSISAPYLTANTPKEPQAQAGWAIGERGSAAGGLSDLSLKGLALAEGPQKLRSGAYTVCEYFFVLFFCIELCARWADLGCQEYFCHYPWSILDFAVVLFGLMDVVLPFFVSPHADDPLAPSVLSVLRMTRVLRLLKLFQVCKELQVIVRAFAKAFSVVLWVGVVVLILDFALTLVLTSLVGQRAYLWAQDSEFEVEGWFGSVGLSMQTLFKIQTLAGWSQIAAVLGEVIPSTLVVSGMVVYIMLCSFAVISLITGAISDTFMTRQRRTHKTEARELQLRRNDMTQVLAGALMSHSRSNPGTLCRFELVTALDAQPVLEMLQDVEVKTTREDLLELYDLICRDLGPGSASLVKVELFAEAACSLAPGAAQASGALPRKCLMQGFRNEVSQRTASAVQDALIQKQDAVKAAKAGSAQIGEVRQEVASVRQVVEAMSQEVAAVTVRLEAQARQAEQDRCEQRQALAMLAGNIQALGTQLFTHSAASQAKVEALSAQVAGQSAMLGKVDSLETELASHRVALGRIEAWTKQVAAKLPSDVEVVHAPTAVQIEALTRAGAELAETESRPLSPQSPSSVKIPIVMTQSMPAAAQAMLDEEPPLVNTLEAASTNLPTGSSGSKWDAFAGIEIPQMQTPQMPIKLEESWTAFPNVTAAPAPKLSRPRKRKQRPLQRTLPTG
ncbi:unnamed protein product [Polarella glacialis]|uniref:Ion transport domain-containing protein n=1 Tax=Polarella glacialis TaxID=89957 RepID=A0A813KQH6_POLGL|nr:unnamed protein product [Polarella glacialis]